MPKNKYFDGPQQVVINAYEADAIDEATSGAGVTIDDVLLKDGQVYTDVINEATSAAGVTADGVLLKDGGIVLADSAALSADVISEKTSANGVVIDGLKIKDGVVGVKQAITGDGAITIQNAYVVLSKGSAAAITLAAPTSGTHDGIVIEVISLTAFAHVITSGVDGFNAKGSSGTLTFGGAVGDSVRLRANGGHWYVVGKVNVTPA